jgi:hypothetical protein
MDPRVAGQPDHEARVAGRGECVLGLTSRLVAVERDMVTFPVAYYFAEADER